MRYFSILAVLLLSGVTASASPLDEILARYDGPLSGTLCVSTPTGDEVSAIGLANDASGERNGAHTLYLIASNTKQFVAAGILRLEELGLLKTTDVLPQHFPEYVRSKKITVEMMLHHTSGLFEAYQDPAIMQKILRQPISLAEIINASFSRPTDFKPGDEWRYGDTNYVLLGELLHRRTGLGFAAFAKQYLFDPAGLSETSVSYPEDGMARVARSYQLTEAGREDYRLALQVADEQMQEYFTDGNIVSSAPDFCHWGRAVLTGKVFGPAAMIKAFTPSRASVLAGYPYGYGWGIGKNFYWHDGTWLGYNSKIVMFPKSGIVIAWLGNQMPPAHEMDKMLEEVIAQVGAN